MPPEEIPSAQYDSREQLDAHIKFHEDLRELIMRSAPPGGVLKPYHVIPALLQTAADLLGALPITQTAEYFAKCAYAAYEAVRMGRAAKRRGSSADN